MPRIYILCKQPEKSKKTLYVVPRPKPKQSNSQHTRLNVCTPHAPLATESLSTDSKQSLKENHTSRIQALVPVPICPVHPFKSYAFILLMNLHTRRTIMAAAIGYLGIQGDVIGDFQGSCRVSVSRCL